MPDIVITNISSEPVFLRDFYVELAPGASTSTFRASDELMAASGLHELLEEGRVSLSITFTPEEQASNFNIFPGISATTAPLDIYVSDINGSDSNTGLTSSTPLKTMAAAENLFPSTIEHLSKLHLGAHGGAGYVLPEVFRQRLLNHRLYIIGDGAGQPGEDGFVELLTGTAGGSSTKNKLVTSGLTPNEFRRRTILIMDGAAAGDRRLISRHDATDVIPSRPFSASVAGASFRIVRSDVRIDLASRPEGSLWFCSNDFRSASGLAGLRAFPRVGFVNLAFEGFGGFETIGSSVFYGCDFDIDAFSLPLFAGPVLGGIDTSDFFLPNSAATAFQDFPLDAPGVLSWAGWGLSGKGDASPGSFLIIVSFTGFMVAPGFFGGGEPFSELIGGTLFGGPGSAVARPLNVPSGTIFVGQVGGAIPVEIRNDGGTAVKSGLFASFASSVADVVLRNVDLIAGGVGDGVVVGGRAIVRHNAGDVTAGRYGYNAVRGGRMDFDDGSTTITATTADTAVNDGSAIKAKATYVAVGDALIDTPNDGSIVQRLD